MGFDATGGKPYKDQQDGPVWYAIVGGVIALSFGIVMIGPMLFGDGGKGGGTIAKLVKGREVSEAAGLINAYGFDDLPTQTFLAQLQSDEPVEHAELLTDMGRAAIKGAERPALGGMMFRWSQDYAGRNTHALANADPAKIDAFLALTKDTLIQLRSIDAGACNIGKLARISTNNDLLSSYLRYGSALYEASIHGNTALVKMVVSGRKNASAEPLEPAPEDVAAVDSFVSGLKSSPEFASLFGADFLNADVCTSGTALIDQVTALPPSQKQLVWTRFLTGELMAEKTDVDAAPAG